jgi:L-lactate dehydrogenase complex protein LldF
MIPRSANESARINSVEISSSTFRKNAHGALGDQALQKALGHIKTGFIERRTKAAARLPEFDALRDHSRDIKNHTLANLDLYLEQFESKVIERGGHVHWCADAAEARRAILSICKQVGARTVTKGKSMVAEEISLNEFLEENNITPVETDLGEYIIQLRHEPPSHIIAPAIHVNKEQVAEAFRIAHTSLPPDRVLDEPRTLLAEARTALREKFITADIGITGANFLIAETGSTVIVTNEGNGDLTQTLPKAHIVLASIEKVVPTLEDVSTILRVLARSATGQEFSVYTTFSTGPRRTEDLDGPGAFHVVLLDNGRSSMLGTEFQEMLRCIRCGACLNHCPVYGAVGGHAYGWVYSGPMGAVLTPWMVGLENARDLPNASTFCGRCESVCPMRIPLPKLMRRLRERDFEQKLAPPVDRWAIWIWGFVARHPRVYRLAARVVAGALARLSKGRGGVSRLPFGSSWTASRDMPAPHGQTFQSLWARRMEGDGR